MTSDLGRRVKGELVKDEAGHVCDSCGEEIVLRIDRSAARE